jgi:hypothetical protein
MAVAGPFGDAQPIGDARPVGAVVSAPDDPTSGSSGVRAAIEFGASLSAADDRDLYLSRGAFDQLDSLVAVIADSLGQIRLRVVDDDAWGMIARGEFAPRGAVALDPLDSSLTARPSRRAASACSQPRGCSAV